MVAYLKRVYSVAEFRTGFVASSCLLLGLGFGIYLSHTILLVPSLLLLISSFCFNVVANIAAEISGYLKQEDNDHQTGHSGSEGLVRGEASLFDAISSLLLFSALAIGTGLIATLITQSIVLILLGSIGFVIAIIYSLTPISINRFPISEFISGLMCGSFCFIAGSLIYIPITVSLILFSTIPLFMVSFLMAANNTTDYYKDLGIRTTFAHIVGFERSISILKPQLILVFIIWTIICLFTIKSAIIFIIGIATLIYFGIYKWYIPYSSVSPDTENLSAIYGPLPLSLLLPFNFIIATTLIILR